MNVAVLPAYNEAATIGSVVLRTLPHADRVLVVDDGSTDDTADLASRAGADVISHEQNAGKGAAIRTGLQAIDRDETDAVALIDADGQHDPSHLPEIFSLIEAGEAEFVIGARTRTGSGSMPRHRWFGRTVLDAATNAFAGQRVTDTQSGFRALDPSVIDRVLPRENGLGIETSMLVRARKADIEIREVSVENHYPDEAVNSMHPARHGVVVLRSLLRTIRVEYPLTFFGTLGIVALLGGFVFGYDTATHYYATDEFWPGKAMLSMLCTLVGTQLLIGAIILDHLRIVTVAEQPLREPGE